MSDLATVASLHPLVGLAQMLGVGLVAAWLLMVVYTVRSLTRPPRRTYTWAVSRRTAGDPGELEPSRAFEAFVFRGRGSELPAWRVVGDDPAGPVVVMTHGWGSSRVGGLKRVHAAAAAANAVVLWDLPGHGEAPGTARLGADEHLDLLALLDSLPPGKAGLVLFGWSMGAGVSIRAAAEDAAAGRGRIRAVIAEAPYIDPSTPARAVMRLRGMPHRLNLAPAMAWIGLTRGVGPRWAGFDRDAHAARLGAVPLTVIHGDADPVCPVDAGRAIAAAAPSGRLVIVPGAGHNDLWTDDRFEPAAARAVRDAVRSDREATGAGVL